MAKFGRILLKLSGEVLAGEGSFGIDAVRVEALAAEVADKLLANPVIESYRIEID